MRKNRQNELVKSTTFNLCNLTNLFLNSIIEILFYYFSGCRFSIGITRLVISQTKPSGENRWPTRQWPKRPTHEVHLQGLRNTHRQQFCAFTRLARKSLWSSRSGMHCARNDRSETRLKNACLFCIDLDFDFLKTLNKYFY